MQKKFHLLVFLGAFIFPFTLHSTDIYKSSDGQIRIHTSLNTHVVPGNSKLGNTVLIVSSPTDLKGINIVTPCEHHESVLYKKQTESGKILYVISLSFPTSCETTDIRVGDIESIFTDTIFSLPGKSFSKIENDFINTNDTELLSIMREQPTIISENIKTTFVEKLQYIQSLYKNLYISFRSDLAQSILHDRNNMKYISPVLGYNLPKSSSLIPGANRSYRKDTTDGVHHGWDILAPLGTPVQALFKGKIIRIKANWNWNEFNNLKKENLTKDDELRNLDIFRGNQVWLQTMDGNIIFYSHLSKISPDIVVGSSVEAGTYLGNIGISGVPDKNYKDIHLHFEVQKNPFQKDMKNPTDLEIMRWDYVGKSLNRGEVFAKMQEIFE